MKIGHITLNVRKLRDNDKFLPTAGVEPTAGVD
jgi:hypothetical protein